MGTFLVFLTLVVFASSCTLGTAPGCTTVSAVGLTRQIAAQLTKMGYTFKTLNASAIRCAEPCVNQLQATAADSLAKAAASRREIIPLTSAFRSCAQQYLLYNWYLNKKCGIKLAAKPGTSNHEGGRAVDTGSWQTWRTTLTDHGWKWHGTSDEVHFDYLNAQDLAKQNLIAFQKLYNQHNPSKKIAEDGIYGPGTAAALASSPCNAESRNGKS